MSQADITNMIKLRVQDNGAPVLNDVKSFTVTVNPLTPVTLTPISYSNGQFRFEVSGTMGPDYIIMATTNLSFWMDIMTNLSPPTPFQYDDSSANQLSDRFYRVRLSP